MKPQNIALHHWEVKLIDFGLSHRCEGGRAFMRHKCGTRGYIAPEVTFARDHLPIEVTPHIDIWAFGMILCVFAVGYNPYEVFR